MNDGPEEKIEYRLDCDKLMAALRAYAYDVYGHKASLREIADFVNVSAATLSRLDRGLVLEVQTLVDICSAIDQPPGSFFERRVWTLKST